MNTILKQQIADAAKNYLAAHSLSQNDLAKKAEINQGYLSLILKGTFETTVNNKPTPIGEKWFAQLATFIGFTIKKSYWQTLPTDQFLRIITVLENCKEAGTTAMLIGNTGTGKTYATDVFVNKNPLHTYRITVSSLYKLKDIITELADMLGIEYIHSNKAKVDAICRKLIDINRTGGKPIVIIDEGENMKLPVLHLVKALYDVLKSYCSIVIIGTDELLTKLLKLRKRGKDGIPQLYRRFKAGCISLEPKIDFKPFYEKWEVEKGLRTLLSSLCENYGELNDYLQPALKAAAERDVELTEDFFRIMYNLPKY